MKQFTKVIGDGFLWNREHERVRVQPWGRNGVRVQVTREAGLRDLPQLQLRGEAVQGQGAHEQGRGGGAQVAQPLAHAAVVRPLVSRVCLLGGGSGDPHGGPYRLIEPCV